MTFESASELLDSWARSQGRAPAREPLLPSFDPHADMLYRVAPESLVIPGYDDAQEGDPDRNARPLEEAMVLSIMAVGVLEPVIVRRRDDAHYEVIAGRRRTRHAREANRRLVLEGEAHMTVPVLVKGARLSSEMAFVVDTTLNEHRENDPLTVKIRKATKMIARGIDPRTIAIAFRVELRSVDIWIRAAGACSEVQTALDAGLPIAAAAEIAALPVEDQPAALGQLQASGHRPAAVRAARAREPVPGRVPKRAVRWVLDAPSGVFEPEFLRGIRFIRGELSEDEVRAILGQVGR